MEDNESPEEVPSNPVGTINITFPQGAHSTNLTVGMSYVDAAQMELAGRFLVRQAENMYAQAAAMAQTQGKGIVLPTPGQIQGLKI